MTEFIIKSEKYKDKIALIDDEDYYKVKYFDWYLIPPNTNYKTFYAMCSRFGKHVKMQYLIIDCPSDKVIDHINHDGLDNRKCNLRICTNNENRYNSRTHKHSYSKYKGVSWDINRDHWVASIQKDGKKIHIGFFSSEEEAAKEYNIRADELFKEFACLNVIK